MKIILASSSPYRKTLLERLKIEFTVVNPDINEDLAIESHHTLVETLSVQKAQQVGKLHPDAFCIGCDTIATMGTMRLGKPLNFETAMQQLLSMSGQTIHFYTGIALHCASKNVLLKKAIITEVLFRKLTPAMITHYLKTEEPYQSCGAFKSETLGTALIQKCQSDDPTAIIGLPLITLCDMLEKANVSVLGE